MSGLINHEFEKIIILKLRAGLTVVVHYNPGLASTIVDMLIGIGSIDDLSKELSGLAHLAEHFILPEQGVPYGDELYDFYIDCRGFIKTYTKYHYTALECMVPAEYAKDAIKYYKRIITNPKITENMLRHQKRIVIREISEYQGEKDQDRAFKSVIKDTLGDDYYKVNTLGSEESLNNITVSDIYEHFKRYDPKDSVLVLDGNITDIIGPILQDDIKDNELAQEIIKDKLTAALEEIFDDWKGTEKDIKIMPEYAWNSEMIINGKKIRPVESRRKNIERKNNGNRNRDKSDIKLSAGWNISNDTNEVILNMACNIIYNHINMQIKEKTEYVYSIDMNPYNLNNNKYIIIDALMAKENINEVISILNDIINEDLIINRKEFENMKRSKALKYRMNTDDILAIIEDMTKCELFSREYIDPEKKAKMYEAVEYEAVLRCIKENFGKLKITLEGSIKQKDIDQSFEENIEEDIA